MFGQVLTTNVGHNLNSLMSHCDEIYFILYFKQVLSVDIDAKSLLWLIIFVSITGIVPY